jgi:hypothetical protein
MSDKPTPEQIEEETRKARRVAALVREHYACLIDTGFAEDEAFQLAENYHWALVAGDEPDDE